MNKFKQTITETIEAVKKVRQAICAYRAAEGKLCDCKFGVHHIFRAQDKLKNAPELPAGEKGNGCPELREAIARLEELKALIPIVRNFK